MFVGRERERGGGFGHGRSGWGRNVAKNFVDWILSLEDNIRIPVNVCLLASLACLFFCHGGTPRGARACGREGIVVVGGKCMSHVIKVERTDTSFTSVFFQGSKFLLFSHMSSGSMFKNLSQCPLHVCGCFISIVMCVALSLICGSLILNLVSKQL